MNFTKLEEQVKKEYPIKEYKGVYESCLHLRSQIEYMESEEGTKLLKEEFGEVKYLSQLDFTKKSLASREAELKFLQRSLLLVNKK